MWCLATCLNLKWFPNATVPNTEYTLPIPNSISAWRAQVLLDVAGATMADLAGAAAPKTQKAAQAAPAEADEEDEALQARLDAVRS